MHDVAKDAAIYLRVSVEHGNRKDNTVQHQLLVAQQYLKKLGFYQEFADGMTQETARICQGGIRIYKDVGYSGLNYDRPDWMRLMADIKRGEIGILVVKDLSRIGRNYLSTGEIVEKILPRYRVRVVAVSDGYDSGLEMADTVALGMKNIINEWYARENGRKVSLVKRQRRAQGEYVGGAAPYGYQIVRLEGRRVLSLDQSMEVVEHLQQMKQEGMTSAEAVVWLTKHRVNRPSVYQKTGKLYADQAEQYICWDSATVRRIWGRSPG